FGEMSPQCSPRIPNPRKLIPDPVAFFHLIRAQLELSTPKRIAELLGAGRAYDRRSDGRLSKSPRNRGVRQFLAALFEERFEPVYRVKGGIVPVAVLIHLPRDRETRVGGRRSVSVVLAGQKSACKRVVDDHSYLLIQTKRDQLVFDLAVKDVV